MEGKSKKNKPDMKYIINSLLSLLLLCVFNGAIYGSDIVYLTQESKDNIGVGLWLDVLDNHGNSINGATQNLSRSAQVRLVYGREDHTDIAGNYWGYEIDYEIQYFVSGSISQTFRDTLVISHDEDEGVYETMKLYANIPEGQIRVEVKGVRARQGMAGAWGSNTSFVPSDVRLEVQLHVKDYFQFGGALQTGHTYTSNSSTSEIELRWNYVNGQEAVELEYVFWDTLNTQSAPSAPDELFAKATRVEIHAQHYKLHLTYPTGTFYYRVRPVGYYVTGLMSDFEDHRRYGPWSVVKQQSLTAFEPDRSWQYTTAFAEGGKSKKVISYFDESMRSRQIITFLNDDERTLVGETDYSVEGQSMISILPVPSNENTLFFKAAFNQNAAGTSYNYTNFDKTGGAEALKNTTGAGQYYSSNNPNTNDIHYSYIPDAAGKPFTQMRYTRDNTGRVAKQGGVGAFYQIGTDRETTYHYGSVSDSELRRLFGSNIGDARYYKKTLTFDANGQGSLSYIDQTGQTVATTLAGVKPENVHELSSAATTTETKNLMAGNTIDLVKDESSVGYGLLNVIRNNLFSFYYELTGTYISTVLNNVPICKDCQYELEITVRDPDGLYMAPDNPPVGGQLVTETINGQTIHKIIQSYTGAQLSSCSTGTAYSTTPVSFDITFPEVGEYRVAKTLRLVPGSLSMQTSCLDDLGVLPDSSSYVNSLISQIDSTQCNFLGTSDSIINAAFVWASEAECLSLLERMSYQVRALSGVSILDVADSTCLSTKLYTIQDVNSNAIKVGFTAAGVMVDNNTGLPISLDVLGSDGSVYTNIDDFNDFLLLVNHPTYYQENWTDVLVLCHREYCHYTYCQGQVNSNVFSLQLARYNTWSEFTSDPLYSNVTPFDPVDVYNEDPYRLLNNCGFSDSLLNWTEPNYTGTLMNYIDTIIFYMNQSSNYNGNMTTAQADTLRWKLFHGMYNAKKEELLESCNPCTYFDDSLALASQTTLPDPSDAAQMDSLLNMGQNMIANNCATLCPVKVDLWMQRIEAALAQCSLSLSVADAQAVRDYLEIYCTQSCGVGNPLAILLQEDYDNGAYPSLTSAMNIVQGYIDNNQPACSSVSLDSVFYNFNQYYYYATDSLGDTLYTTVTTPFPDYLDDHCYENIIQTLNQALQSPNVPATDRFRMNIPCLGIANEEVNFTFNSVGSFGIAPDGLDCAFNFHTYSDTATCTFYRTLWADITSVEYIEVVQAAACWTGSESTNTFVKVALTTQNNTVDTAYIHVYGKTTCTEVVDSIPIVLLKIDSNATYDYNLDSAYWDCIQVLVNTAVQQGTLDWQNYIDSILTAYNASLDACWNTPFEEIFRVSYDDAEYHYTLYYYDQAGNLVQTLPPLAVEPLDDTHFDVNGVWDQTEPTHKGFHLATQYKYNSLGQVTEQTSPDGGKTVLYYDDVQRVRLAQNAKQAANDQYSYTKYDGQSRPIEVGQLENFVSNPTVTQLNDPTFPSSSYVLSEKTVTIYDDRSGATYTTEHLRGRVAQIRNEHMTINYDYDIIGNVKHVEQRINDFENFDIYYDYDLISGNVNQVAYQPNKVDGFYHRYGYDADNRLQLVETSDDGYLWAKEARYLYYTHGPLARVELGDGVQGLDYYYNLQGWIMGVNMPNHEGGKNSIHIREYDLGLDGKNSSNNMNEYTAIDAFAYGLGYHEQAYSPIDNTVNLGALTNAWTQMDGTILNHQNGVDGFFNGNIAFMIRQVPELGKALAPSDATASQYALMGTTYQYDQLHRIRQSRSYAYTEQTGNYNWLADNLFNTNYDYDANGNIKTLSRQANGTIIDDLTYTYKNNALAQPLHNQLLKVNDVAGNTPALGDLKDQGSLFDNYNYDEIGNLVQDSTEGIEKITWNLQGKVQQVEFLSSTGKPDIQYTYDPMGNRLSKTIVGEKSTIYIRDPQGNVLSIYEHRLELSPTPRVVTEQLETMIYGSSRLGSKKCTQVIKIDSLNTPVVYITERTCLHRVGHKFYELSNHLGNVLATVTDKKVGQDSNADDQADYYMAATVNSQFYYAFGWNIPGRQINPQNTRHGFNGMEKDPEISNGTNETFYRKLDTRIARWWSVDPVKHHTMSPYNSMDNTPIAGNDINGGNTEWIPEVQNTTDADGNITNSRLVARMEEGDNASTLADFLDITQAEANQLFNQQANGVVVIPDNRAGNINQALADVINPSGNDYVDNFFIPSAYETNYNCWESCLSLAEGDVPDFNNTIDQGITFARELLDNYENVSERPNSYIFGRTAIRFAKDHERAIGGAWNETTHGANYLGTSRDGTIYVWTKDGRIEAPRVATLQEVIDMWGQVQGAGPKENEGGFYNFRE